MVAKKTKKGAPKGTVNNPAGINQYPGIRAQKMIGVRLLKDRDAAIREKAEREGKTITAIFDEAIDLYLTADNS
jgi:hypothetical protein